MSLAVLNQVYDETRRLAIAGSNLAAGDFRLTKLVDPLEKSAAKAPVFGQVAASIQRLVDAPADESAQALLDLSSLVSAILYTQGQTTIQGDLEPIATSSLGTQTTQVSAKLMKPLLEALTSTGSGRMETIREAYDQGAFADLRIINLAVAALDDTYPELADFVADRILPGYGRAIVPLIAQEIDIKGRAGNVRRLRTLYRLDPQAARPLVLEAFGNGSKDMKIAALGCLGDSDDDLPHLHDQAKARSKEVRRVALERLARFDDEKTIAIYSAALNSKDLELAAIPVSQNASATLAEVARETVRQQATDLLESKTRTKLGPALVRFHTLLLTLQERSDEPTLELLQWLFSQHAALTALKGTPVSGADVVQQLTQVMLSTGAASMHQLLVESRDELPDDIFVNSLRAGVESLTPQEVYKVFSPYYQVGSKVRGKAKQRHEAVQRFIVYGGDRDLWYMHSRVAAAHRDSDGDETDPSRPRVWDPAWLDDAIAQDDLEAVTELATMSTPPLDEYLSTKFAALLKRSARVYELRNVVAVMIRIGHAEATDSWIAAIEKLGSKSSGYGLYWITQLAGDLPAAEIPKVEAILPTLPESAVDEIVAALGPRRQEAGT
ncbi:hypothetical protein [Rosistilla oblonga]|uniref:HEAT repeat protein n=1 Tax=Rosistilla oblonga TaxID=2527990 RepID=A0A518IYM1_9BACT|nr:hypothetical protein [Rosistilla oblonga]QDV58168.1 hypothetical protein Mal33_41850 [Rosistilla oblonga]